MGSLFFSLREAVADEEVADLLFDFKVGNARTSNDRLHEI